MIKLIVREVIKGKSEKPAGSNTIWNQGNIFECIANKHLKMKMYQYNSECDQEM